MSNETPHQASQPKICATCRWYRVKAEDGDGNPVHMSGMCDHATVHAQIHIMSWSTARHNIESELRFRGDFRCGHWQRAPWAQEESA